jgi:hypothetical protein
MGQNFLRHKYKLFNFSEVIQLEWQNKTGTKSLICEYITQIDT